MTRSLGPIVALVILASACGGSDTVAPTSEPAGQSSEPASSTAPVTTTAASEPAQTVDAPELSGTSWNVTDYSQAPPVGWTDADTVRLEEHLHL